MDLSRGVRSGESSDEDTGGLSRGERQGFGRFPRVRGVMQFYTVADLRAILKLSASQVYALIEACKLRCHRFTPQENGEVSGAQAQLEAYLRETEGGPEGESVPAADKPEAPRPFTCRHLELS